MSKVKQADIDRLIDLVGGRDNIATVSHCITRLRFVLHQPANARPKEIEQLPMVKGCFTNAGQFQVVIGTDVGDYYNALLETTGKAYADKEQAKKAARQNMKWHEQLISHFAEIFFPLLPALISGGLILGFRNVIGDVPMSNGQTLAQMHPALKTLYDFLWLIGDGVAFAVRYLMTGSFAPIGAALFGFLYAPLVITGVHQTTLAIDMQMIQSMGGTPVWPLIALSNIAQASAVVGIIISSRKHNEREISVPAAISAYLGVTEPAMYGINLKYRFPMLCAMIGSGLAGLLCGLNGVIANGIGVGGLPGILSIPPRYWQVYGMAMVIAIVIPVILTTFIYQRKHRQGTLQIV